MKTIIKHSSWWRRRTTLERCLIQISALAFFLPTNQMAKEILRPVPGKTEPNTAAAQNIATGNSAIKDTATECKPVDICLSAECTQTACAVLNKMKTDVEPCDDFYQFACGKYMDETEISDDEVIVDIFSDIENKLQVQLKSIITEERPETQPKHLKLPNLLYKACMNETLIEFLGTKPFKRILDSLGGWPIIVGSSWNGDNTWTWQETVKKLRRFGFRIDYIIDFFIGTDLMDSTKRIINLDQSSTGLSRKYLRNGFNDTLVLAYYNYMVDMAVLLGAKKEAAIIELKKSLQFEIDLAKISRPSEETDSAVDFYNLRTIKQLQASYPYVKWEDYINAFLSEDLKVDKNEVINLSVPSFFVDLGKLLDRTDNRVIANYIMCRMLDDAVPFLTEELRYRQLKFRTFLSGKRALEARWKECVHIVSYSLALSVGSLYVRKHFTQDSETIATEIVENIRGAFSQILDKVGWMDAKTKEKAKRKLYAMNTHIGYHDEILDNDKLEEYYQNLEINPYKYFESILNMNAFAMNYSVSGLRIPVNKTDWVSHAHPTEVDAFYSLTENSIQLPAGIWNNHFFNSQRPKYMNYGAIGFAIGHEIIHGFGDSGRQFDDNGNLADWWQPKTEKTYLEKAKCIIDQYSNFTDDQTGLNLNGFKTQRENIADNGGLKISYLAYNQWVSKNGVEPRLPALNYTPNQMFWISAAQSWCTKYRTETLKMRIATGVHSPNKFRVLGPFRNMKDFARDFQCPEGTAMNPVLKCEVW